MTGVPVPGLELPDLPGSRRLMLPVNGVTLGGYGFAREEAPGVVVLHGWGQDASDMAWAARALHEAGFAVRCLSLRGWRGSSGCDDYGVRQPDDIARVVEGWRATLGGQPVGVFGFSQGGLVALLAAARSADVRAVAALNPPTDLRAFARDTAFDFVRRYLNTVCADGLWQERSPLHHARAISAPTLLLAGSADRHVPPAQSAWLAARLTRGELVELPHAAHLPNAPERAVVLAHLTRFFKAHLR